MGFDELSTVEQKDVRDGHATLTDASVLTTLEQVADAAYDVRSWQLGKRTLGQLCADRGWERSVIHPEYRTEPKRGTMVYLLRADVERAVQRAKDRTGTVTAGVRTKSGQLRPLPVVTVRRPDGSMRDQTLTHRAWGSSEEGMAWAEMPVNRPPRPGFGYGCPFCNIANADRLRADVDDRVGLICADCDARHDMKTTPWPLFM